MEKHSSMVSFLITLLLATTVHTNGQEPVRDIAGNPVLIDEEYFIQPVKTTSNNGGGLVPAAINIFPFCPLGITQSLLSEQPGLPVSFRYRNVTPLRYLSSIYVVSITFVSNIWPVCNNFSKIWEIDTYIPPYKEPPVLIGGNILNNNSSFRIVKAGEGEGANTYRIIVFRRGPVGTIPGIWGGAPQLVLTNDTSKTLYVTFKKVDVTTTVTSRFEKFRLKMFPFY